MGSGRQNGGMATPRKITSPRGLALIRSAESFSATVYLCPAGKPTIGYGHVLREGDHLTPPISRERAELLLCSDLAPVEIYLAAVFPALNQNEFDALASFAFNVGLGAFEGSTLFKKLKVGDKAGASAQFGRWISAKGKVLPGLLKRRAAERDLFLSPETSDV